MNTKKGIKLEDITKENSFKVPDNYFENFDIRMAERISQAEAVKAPKPTFAWLQPRYVMAVSFAAFVLFLLAGSVFFYRNSQKPLSAKELADVYEFSALKEMDDTQLAELIASAKEHEGATDTTENTKNDLSKKSILEYLSHENIDLNTLIEAQ
jgi:hypothetical protein